MSSSDEHEAQNTPVEDEDQLEGQELRILNKLLAATYPRARSGDDAAIDRVLKILDLKRRYRRDKQIEEL